MPFSTSNANAVHLFCSPVANDVKRRRYKMVDELWSGHVWALSRNKSNMKINEEI